MPDFLTQLFSSDRFMPHGHCYLWNPALVWLHVISDALIAAAYTSIPFTLVHFARKRKDIPFNWMFVCFGMFIIACGATHLMEIWTLWTPTYWLSGVIKAITAAASVPTALLLIRLLPRAIAMPTAIELSKAHDDLRKAHEVLESRVKERTAELAKQNAALEKEVRERQYSERRFRRLVDSGIMGIVISDASGKVTDANDSFLKTVGYTREDLAEGRLESQNLNVPDVARLDAAARAEIKELGFAHPWEKELIRKDGTRVTILAGVAVLEETLRENVAFILDLTDAKRAEAEARHHSEATDRMRVAKEAAEEANAELEAFSYSVAHDLRAPLRAINGFSAALQEDYGAKLDEDGRRQLGRITAGATRMSELIDALLALARLSRTEVNRQLVDVTEVGRKVTEQLRAGEPARDVEVVVAEGLTATGDPHLITTLLENLLGNAWKFTGRTSGARIELGREETKNGPSYFVRDNGAGFDMDLSDKLFAPFRRLHTAAEFEGTGIGLATVQRIVRRHGGRVWAEGAENAGAVFHFTLGSALGGQ